MAIINQGIRFLIMERDKFSCQYCGRKPPEVQLEVDHIKPQVENGEDISTNLITACFDCNRGKSGKSFKDLIKTPKKIHLPVNEKFHYKVYSIRLGEDTIEQLKTAKYKSEKSWNLFIKDLLKENK